MLITKLNLHRIKSERPKILCNKTFTDAMRRRKFIFQQSAQTWKFHVEVIYSRCVVKSRFLHIYVFIKEIPMYNNRFLQKKSRTANKQLFFYCHHKVILAAANRTRTNKWFILVFRTELSLPVSFNNHRWLCGLRFLYLPP